MVCKSKYFISLFKKTHRKIMILMEFGNIRAHQVFLKCHMTAELALMVIASMQSLDSATSQVSPVKNSRQM